MRCLRSRLSVFVYNVCVIGTIPYIELFRAMDTHVQLRTADQLTYMHKLTSVII